MGDNDRADDYADILTAIFSLAAIDHGYLATPVESFHRLMVALRREFPNEMPSFDNDDRPGCGYSSLLADALRRTLFAEPPRFLTDDRKNLVVDKATAVRNLNGFDPFSRRRLIRRFSRVAARLVAIQRATDDGPSEPPTAS